MPTVRSRTRVVVLSHALAGAVLGVLFLHPITMAIYWFEFHPGTASGAALVTFVAERTRAAFSLRMLPMTGVFAILGGAIGLASGLYTRALLGKSRVIGRLASHLAEDVPQLIRAGESDSVEFKASLRWDYKQSKVNKELEAVILKTLAGFMNQRGGNLLIGVRDDGHVVGLQHDYATLRKKDRDGFQLALFSLAREHLGVRACALIHPVFQEIDGQDACRVLVYSTSCPVYVTRKGTSHYFLRNGNATIELGVQEAHEHIRQRFHEPL